jgi:hypothetical protein
MGLINAHQMSALGLDERALALEERLNMSK